MSTPEMIRRAPHALAVVWTILAMLVVGAVVVPLAAEVLRGALP